MQAAALDFLEPGAPWVDAAPCTLFYEVAEGLYASMLYACPGYSPGCVVNKHLAVVSDAAGEALGGLVAAAKKRTLQTAAVTRIMPPVPAVQEFLAYMPSGDRVACRLF